jgi:hypothetical protein
MHWHTHPKEITEPERVQFVGPLEGG